MTSTFFRNPRMIIGLLASMYAFGLLGIILPLHPDFALLTPFNLLGSLSLVLLFHPEWKQSHYIYFGLCYIVGFGAEIFGVQTGILFGDYNYGPVLGWKILETPIMIGINWVLLSYLAGVSINHILEDRPWWQKGILAAASLVALDLLIEPGAIKYDFWSWELGYVPLQNYLGWFIVALPLQLYFAYFLGNIKNIVAVALFIMQFLFFLILSF